jgi:hypothetical protein
MILGPSGVGFEGAMQVQLIIIGSGESKPTGTIAVRIRLGRVEGFIDDAVRVHEGGVYWGLVSI